jgi:uncharacterized protein (TIGR02453 family)
VTFEGFPAEGLRFLRDLATNNNKPWFDANRETYVNALLEPGRDFVEALGERLQTLGKYVNFDPRVGGSVGRIYRDTRFKKDKRPYKDHLDFWFPQGLSGGWDNPGFWLRLTPDAVHLGVGTHWLHDGETLTRFRQAVADPRRGAALSRALTKVRTAGDYRIEGEHYKRVPKGFPTDHPRADLLRYHSLTAYTSLEPLPPEVHTAGFVDLCLGHFKVMAPVQRWIYAVLSAA